METSSRDSPRRTKPHRLEGTFSYTAPGDGTDIIPPPPNYAGTFRRVRPGDPIGAPDSQALRANDVARGAAKCRPSAFAGRFLFAF